jgi:hypothetical protein
MAHTKSTTKTAAGQTCGLNPANWSHFVTGSTAAAASVNEADSAFGYFRRSHQFADRRKNGTDAFIMPINSFSAGLQNGLADFRGSGAARCKSWHTMAAVGHLDV